MCGIVGIWDYKNKISPDILEKMRDVLTYRGPDDAGLFIDKEGSIGLGHRRLSIIDLSLAGHQPMSSDDESLWIVFNGEIYNFKEIRKDLEQKGYKFKSNSDTEVIIKAYQEWGKKAVNKFRGMFAFAVLDKKNKKLVICRDRAGVKPLYYHFDGNLFIFASELKAIILHPKVKKEINLNSLALFLKLGYVPEPHSIFKNIYKLEAGYFLEINANKEIKKEKYWDIVDVYLQKNKELGDEENIKAELEKVLIDSFKLRLVSDVPVGIFLSGGIDSTLLTALLAKNTNYPLKTFTIGFEEKEYDESEYAKNIANYFKTEHYQMICTAKDALDIVFKLPEIYDEPFGDPSAIPTYLVSKFTKEQVKVSLSADGGDELFCGYNHYAQINSLFGKINKTPSALLAAISSGLKFVGSKKSAQLLNLVAKYKNSQNKIKKLEKVLHKKNNLQDIFDIIGSNWLKDEVKDLLIGKVSFPKEFFSEYGRIKDLEPITQMQIMSFKGSLCGDMLVKVDRATMSVGLEGRDPFLDQNIIEYASKLTLKFKYKNGQSKYILRKILEKYIPKELFERPKTGFLPPIDVWLKKELKPLAEEYLNPKKIIREGIFNADILAKELNNYFSGELINTSKLWPILMFEMWKEKYLQK